MIRIMAVDFEVSIGKTVHSSTFRDLSNDIYTQIYGSNPSAITVIHNPVGYKRDLKADISEIDVLLGHNIAFDLCYVWRTKKIQDFILKGGKIWDTQQAEYILTGQQHSTASLAELQNKYLGEVEKPSRITKLFKKGIGADRIVQARTRCKRLFKLYDYYCHTDGSTPLKIFKAQYLRAKKHGMLEIVELYNDYLLAIINMTCSGIHIDVEKAELLKREFTIKSLECIKDAQDIMKSVWTDPRLPEFKITSNDHRSVVLFGGDVKTEEKVQVGFYKPKRVMEEYTTEVGTVRRRCIGLEEPEPKFKMQELLIEVSGYNVSTSLTRPAAKEGFYSTDKKVIKNIKADGTASKDVLSYCNLQEQAAKFEKAATTYCKALIERSVDGVLYPNFNTTITPTGRLSSSKPNMQNIPSKGELAESVMGLLVAPPGWVAVSSDYSQLEKWIQALVSNDMNLRELLEKGVCLHCTTLAKVEGLDYDWVYQKAKVEGDPIWDAKRTAIKPVGFQMDYGASPKTVSADTGMPLADVEAIYKIDKELYPEKHFFFDVTIPESLNKTATFSLAENIPANKKKPKHGVPAAGILGKVELLPIFDSEGKVGYNKGEIRKVGYWSTNYGKKYHFTDLGRESKYGIRRGFHTPAIKNYCNQGGAADVMAAVTAEMLKVLIKGKDKIQLVNQVHDSQQFYVREDALEGAIKWIQEIMEDVPKIFKRRFNIDFPFRLPCEIKIGRDFGNMKKYKLGEKV